MLLIPIARILRRWSRPAFCLPAIGCARRPRSTGGYYLIEAPDLDAALSWAQRCPGATEGAIEVRPAWGM
jgi:hypothetical protein